MTIRSDGRYDHTKPWVPQVSPQPVAPRWSYVGPWASNEERLTQQALQSTILPGEDVADLVRVPLPQVALFPDRFGYGDRTAPTIYDVVDVNRDNRNPRVSWFSGGVAGYSGSSRNALGNT